MADPFFYNRNPSVLGEIGKKFSRTGTFFPQYKSLPRQIRQVYGGPARKRMGFPQIRTISSSKISLNITSFVFTFPSITATSRVPLKFSG